MGEVGAMQVDDGLAGWGFDGQSGEASVIVEGEDAGEAEVVVELRERLAGGGHGAHKCTRGGVRGKTWWIVSTTW